MGRVHLEPLRVDHAVEMWSVLAAESLYEFTGGEPPSREALDARYRAQVSGSGSADELWRNWVVRRTDTAEAVGFVQATVVGEVADIAWLVGEEHQGRGLATQAVRLMVDELASSGVVELTAQIHPDHERSQRVASGVGLRRSGDVDDDGEEVWAFR